VVKIFFSVLRYSKLIVENPHILFKADWQIILNSFEENIFDYEVCYVITTKKK
jgi:hypothetical protein